MSKAKKGKWKPLAINLENAAELLCFEELSDYTAIRGEVRESSRSEIDDMPCKIRKRKKKLSNPSLVEKRKSSDLDCPVPDKMVKKNSSIKHVQVQEILTDVIESDFELGKMNSWKEFNLPESILKALAEKKFVKPTEIQRLALPEAIVKRKDILGAAETGSGKTLAFGIPIVASILVAKESGINTDDAFWALIVTPTRELAIQVKNHLKDLCKFTNIRVQEIVGGLSVEKQNRKLKEKPQIIVATPGRLWEMIRGGNEFLAEIHRIRFLVIDEADRMFEKNHFEEFPYLLERINYPADKSKPENRRQTLVFSATLTLTHAPPSYVLKKKKGRTKQSAKITSEDKLKSFINSLDLKNPSVLDITKKNVLADGISENCVLCSLDDKDYFLYYILKMHPGKKIIFANSVGCVKRLHRLLNILECNPKLLFADMAQNHRLNNLENFEKNPNGLLLATDVAARGLDIANIDMIIHYQIPKTSELYVHRSGRSVRGLSAEGTSIALCCPGENYFYTKIRNTLGKDKKYPSYTITRPEVFAVAKKAVDISRNIERAETKIRNVQLNANWVEKCAKEMDILLDDDEKPEKINDETRKKQQQQIKRLKAELKSLLLRPVLPLQESLKYPQFGTVQSYMNQRALNKC